MTEDDAELVALIDGELDEASEARLLTRLTANDALRRRYEALHAVGAPIADGLAAILDAAPLARLAAALPSTNSQPAPSSRRFSLRLARTRRRRRDRPPHRRRGRVPRAILVAAFRRRRLAGGGRRIRRTLQCRHLRAGQPGHEQEAAQLRAVNQKLETAITSEQLALPGLKFKTAQLLNYEGKPLAEIAFVDEAGQPVLFCVTSGGKADRPRQAETRGEFALASWARGGHQFMVIGRLPEARVADLAATLSTHI